MPSYQWNEKLGGRKSRTEQTGTTYQRQYQLVTSTRITEADAKAYAFGTAGLAIGQPHPVDTTAKLRSVEAEDEADDGNQWLVTVEWSTPTGGVTPDADPLARLPEVSWQTQAETEAIRLDKTSPTPLRIRSSAGEEFQEPPQRDRGVLTCTYARNETEAFFRGTVLPLMAYDFIVNSASFTIDGVSIPALYARLEIRSATRTTEGLTTYYRVEYVLQFRQGPAGNSADGWRRRYLDLGTYENPPGAPNFWRPILDEDGLKVQTPWPLDGSGQKRAHPYDAPAEVGPFKLYSEFSFAPLAFS